MNKIVTKMVEMFSDHFQNIFLLANKTLLSCWTWELSMLYILQFSYLHETDIAL